MPNRYENMNIVIVGAGKSGQALCRFFASRVANIVLSDQRIKEQIVGIESLENLPIIFDLGGHDDSLFRAADLVVLSPGVPASIAPVQAALEKGTPVIGETEVAVRELTAPMIGITGTNGKSTVTALVGAIFKACGKKSYVGGNIGEPLIDAVATDDWQWLIIELSSFQLETMQSFRPRYSMLLNISADHLDRYRDMAAYVAAKKNIFMNQQSSDFMILNADDPEVLRTAAGSPAKPIYFSSRKELPEGMFLQESNIVWRWQGDERTFPVSDLNLSGLHNIVNVMAALIPALVEGYSVETVWQAVCEFKALPHRMNLVSRFGEIDWYNDSKGTNVGSVIMSLAGLAAPVTLIAGGKDKGGDFGELSGSISAKVEHLILLGEAAARMAREIGEVTEIHLVNSLEEAVLSALEVTRPGGSVLLSPGCSSFDMFANFAERGEQFCRLVQQLEAGKGVSNGNPTRI